jgi:hypothetical protein
MEPIQFRQINKDILSVLYNKKNLGISESRRKPKVIPQLEKVNSEIPYLTEQKLEEAYLSSKISDKTKKLLAWLQIKENLLEAEKTFHENKEDFADLSLLLEMRKVDFRSFVNHMINKHLNEKPS